MEGGSSATLGRGRGFFSVTTRMGMGSFFSLRSLVVFLSSVFLPVVVLRFFVGLISLGFFDGTSVINEVELSVVMLSTDNICEEVCIKF